MKKMYKLLVSLMFFAAMNTTILRAEKKQVFGQDLLLIVVYNHPYYESIDLLKKFYEPWFPHIVFYGSQEDSRVEYVEHERGFWGYKALADAMEKYPGYKGYLYTNDDCIINFWNLIRFDKEKIWHTGCGIVPFIPNATPGWPHWGREYGYSHLKEAYEELPARYHAMIEKNCGPSNSAFSWADIFYMPSKYKDDVVYLCNLFAKYKVFLEVALASILYSLEKKREYRIY